MVKIVPIYRRTQPPKPPAIPTLTRTPFGTFYRCDFCPYRTRLLTSITDHLSNHNTRTFRDLFSCDRKVGDTYPCPCCEIRSPLKFLLVEHVKLRHWGMNITPTFPKVHECAAGGCGFKSHSKIRLQEHALRKLGSVKFVSVHPNVSMSAILKHRMMKKREHLAIKVRRINQENRIRVREKVTKLRPILPKMKTFPKVILFQQSIIFQCARCLFMSINHPTLIKRHLMDQHFKGPDNGVMYKYDVFRIDHKLTLTIDAQQWAYCGKNLHYFQCRKCSYRTEIWNDMRFHFHMNVGHDFYEVVDKKKN